MRRLALVLLWLSASARAEVTMIDLPAGAGAGQPFLSSAAGSLLLSWLEPAGGGERRALRFARLTGERWSPAVTIVESSDLFVNWADFPSVVQDRDGVLFAHWLQKSGASTYAYDIMMSISRDGGGTWSEPFPLNRDGTKTEHGFASLVPNPSGGIAAVWLDGRKMPEGKEEGDMTLRYADVSAKGELRSQTELDTRTCECCTTGMAMTSSGAMVVYRDRSLGEIRDVAAVRRTKTGWTRSYLLHPDGWKIDGCPVNGPQIDAVGRNVIVAWFTGAGDQARVRAAFSGDGGATFAPPLTVDDGKPAGRVDVLMLDAHSAVVSWLEQTASGAEIRLRRVERNAPLQPSVKIGDSSAARAAGFPRMARVGTAVYLAWTDQSASTRRIQMARTRF